MPPLPQDKQEVEPAFDLLKSMVAVGRAAPDNLNLPPPLVHAAGDSVVPGTALEKFIGGVYSTQLPPTVTLENIAEAGYIVYLIQLRCQALYFFSCLFFFDANRCHVCPALWTPALIGVDCCAGSHPMSVTEHVQSFSTPDRPILVPLGSKQIAALGGLGDPDFLVPAQRWLQDGFNVSMGFSVCLAGIKSIKDPKWAQMMCSGDSVNFLYCSLKKDFQAAQENVQALLKLLPYWKTVDFVLLDPMSRDLYEEGGRMAKEMLINAECMWKGERNVLNHGMKIAWVPWVVRVTYVSSHSAKPADLRTLPLFATGQDSEHRLFVEHEMSPSLMAVQAHV